MGREREWGEAGKRHRTKLLNVPRAFLTSNGLTEPKKGEADRDVMWNYEPYKL